MLSLSKAIKENRLDEFVEQQEAAGVGPIHESEFLGFAPDEYRPLASAGGRFSVF